MRPRSSSLWASCLLVTLLVGCAVGPNYQRPTVEVPTSFSNESSPGDTNSLADLPWWGLFKDATLQALIHTALTNNFDLRIAVQRLEQARLLQIQAQSVLFPQIGYGAEAARGRNMFLNLPNLNHGAQLDSFLGGFDVLWEVDLWGRIRRQTESAHASFLAVQESKRGIRLALMSAVARAYIELLELDERREIAQRTADSFSHTYDLFSVQHENGLASKLELSRARAALKSVSAAIPELQRQMTIKENELRALLGQNPGPIPHRATLQQQALPPEIPLGLPSLLLERRPDLRQAEQQLRAANAQVGVAAGDFLPRIGLTALYGGVSTELSSLTSGSANAWSLAATTTGPIFQAGRLKARYRHAQAAREQARLQYEKTAMEAFHEVANALVSRQQYRLAREQQAAAVEALKEAFQAATERYDAGKAGYYEVLEAQQQLFPAENALSQLKAAECHMVIQLYKALGGGWKLEDGHWTESGAGHFSNRSP